MKKIVNSAETVVVDALHGLAAAHPRLLRVDHSQRVVFRAGPSRPGKVALISGGGSGHEPLHAGYVGRGMLDAACVGEVFTSPVPDQIIAATLGADTGAGVLHIVKNYTGDVLNFELAAELAAAETGVRLRTVVTDDDVAVRDSTFTAGRRGVGVTVLLEKLVGAAAEQGRSLDDLADLAERVNGSGRSMGLALGPCTVPAVGHPTFDLGPDEIEVGIGIHGEPGRERRPLGSAAELARLLTEPVLAELPGDGPVLAFLNGLGGTPLLELYVLYREVATLLADAGVRIDRSLVGNYITSLEMPGATLTLLRLDPEWTALWDEPVDTPALRWGC